MAKKLFKKTRGRIRTFLRTSKTSLCYRSYFNSPIQEDLIFIESRNGLDMAGNMLRIIQQIRKDYGSKYTIVSAAKKEKKQAIQQLFKNYGLQDIKVLNYESVTYYNYLEKAKYLFNDSTFPDRFIKRKEQVYLNTWHGSPLKHMGRDSAANRHLMHNVQRNLFMSDFIVAPSEYCKDILVGAYCLDGLYEGTILKEGYPRNTIFFDAEARAETKKKYHLEDKKVYVYMPTFREAKAVHQDSDQKNALKEYFDELDGLLQDDEVFIVKLHYYVAQDMDFSSYKHIQVFPKGIETYEFLNIADTLVTDYSSVFYDFANTKSRIIRWVYDKEDYFNYRGFYEQPKELPFPEVITVEELVTELHKDSYEPYDAFVEFYCKYDNKDATKHLVQKVFENKACQYEESIYTNQEKVVIYGGAFDKNGITTSMVNLINALDDEKKYYASYSRKSVGNKKQNMDIIDRLPNIFEVSGYPQITLKEAFAIFMFYKQNIDNGFTRKYLDRLYKRELIRSFGCVNFSKYVQFVGYERVMISMFQRVDKPNCIFVHSDMVQELAMKNNQHRLTLEKAYREYDKVAVVSDYLVDKTAQISGRRDNIVVCENVQDYLGILNRSELPIEVQARTAVVFGSDLRISKEEIETPSVMKEPQEEPTLEDQLVKTSERIETFINQFKHKFITIGRFSVEKQHERLIEAFEKYCEEDADCSLIIVGGYGPKYNDTMKRVEDSPWKDHILMIRNIFNPLPILKRCDCFILSSDYEGAPMVFHEAHICGLPIISTHAGGATSFMKKYGGYLVDNTSEAIYKGMKKFTVEGLPKLNIDYKTYNANCIRQFLEDA